MSETAAFVGIDVSEKRGLAVALIGGDGTPLDAVWLPSDRPNEIKPQLDRLLTRHSLRLEESTVGVDAPRYPLLTPRKWNWEGKKGQWQLRKISSRGFGRHCEIVIRAHGLGNPQWTPILDKCPEWMRMGFDLFKYLDRWTQTVEVFPSASYTQLKQARFHLEVILDGFTKGPKDMLDAFVAAATAREYVQGRGVIVGDGDGLGGIVLPRPLKPMIHMVLTWPTG